MKNRKKKILIILSIILVGMAVGYSIFSVTLKVTGTAGIQNKWNVYISNIEEKELNAAETVETEIIDKTTANFSVNLKKPGSYAEYEVTVKNAGKLDAILKGINGISEANEKEPKDVVYTIKELEINTPLPMGEEIKFIVRVEFKKSASILPSIGKDLELSLDYEQSTGINNPDIAVNKPSYSIDQTGWQTSKKVTITYPERREELIYEYSLDQGNTWMELKAPATTIEIPFTSNGSVIARITDGMNELRAEEYKVEGIITEGPSATVVVNSKTSKSITLKATCTDESGISKIEFSKDNGSTFVENGVNTIYVFNDLKSGTYQFQTRCTNGVGIQSTSEIVEGTPSVIGTPTYSVDQTGWQSSKKVTITYPSRQTGFIYEYSIDEGTTWTEVASPTVTKEVTFTEEGSVIARVRDGINTVTAEEYEVAEVDSTGPGATLSVTSKTSKSVTLKATCTDNQSGISEIEFSKDNGSTYTSNGTTDTYTFNDLKTGTYQFKTRCTNGVGIKTVSTSIDSETNTIGTPSYSVDKTGWQKSKIVTITYPVRETSFIYEYSLDSGKTWTEVEAPAVTKEVTFTSNGSVIARVRDGVNTVTASAFAVTEVDSVVPTIKIASYSPSAPESNGYYSSNVTVTLDLADTGGSGVAGFQYAISTDGGTTYSGWSALKTGTSFPIYTEGTNVVYIYRVKDNAGNASKGVVSKAIKLDKEPPTYTSVEIKNQTTTGYDIYIYGVEDAASGVNKVQLPIQTDLGGKDDRMTSWETNTKAAAQNLGDGTWKYHVNISDHMNEGGRYMNHVYLYDNLGKSRLVKAPSVTMMIKNQTGSYNFDEANQTFDGTKSYKVGSTERVYNNATYEFQATPTKTISLYENNTDLIPEVNKSTFKQNWIIAETHGGTSDVGYGVSVGTNGVMMVGHKDAYYRSVLKYAATLSASHKYRVVIQNKVPYLYIDNKLVATGIAAPEITGNVFFTNLIGKGHYGGNFTGTANYFNLYSYARK